EAEPPRERKKECAAAVRLRADALWRDRQASADATMRALVRCRAESSNASAERRRKRGEAKRGPRANEVRHAPAAAHERRRRVAREPRRSGGLERPRARTERGEAKRGPRANEVRNGAGNGIRTRDFDLGKVALYH